ncbi:hypothetical protein AEB_P0347 [Altererythrobacter sp. B11]|nr:hypothetical protein [Altererythrobacter sp. B11]BBC71215.1 hypothetical protein AEB_P0347 [Altererythrobacter sp. B11]
MSTIAAFSGTYAIRGAALIRSLIVIACACALIVAGDALPF